MKIDLWVVFMMCSASAVIGACWFWAIGTLDGFIDNKKLKEFINAD